MNGNGCGKLSFGEFELDQAKRMVWHRDQPVDIPLKAIELLCLLVEKRGDVVTKEEIWERVWNGAFLEETNLTHNIYILRKTFRQFGAEDVIKTVPRRGYRFVADVSATNGKQLIYERATITDTLIEEVPYPDDHERRRSILAFDRISAFAIGVLLVAGVAAGLSYLRSASAAKTKIDSMAVLPFQTLSTGTNEEQMGAGLSDLLVTRLSNIRGLSVRPTSSIAGLDAGDALSAGQKLNVNAVLEGTVFRSGEQVRITARLIRVADGTVIWSGEFQKPASDELAAQNDLAIHIADALRANLHEDERAALLKNYTGSIDALRLYERGRFEWNKRSRPGMIEAQRFFRNAIEKDPNFALAYSGLADTLATGSAWDEALTAARRALEIDPNLAQAHATDGFIRMFQAWDWNGAESSFKRSIELNPGYATAHHWYATLLAIRGRLDDAKAEMQRAMDIDPLSFNYVADMGQLYYFSGDNARAKEYCDRALELNPDFIFAHQYLHFIYLATGQDASAVEEIITADKLNDGSRMFTRRSEEVPKYGEQFRQALKERGLRGFLEKRYPVAPTHPESFYLFAMKNALLGEKEKALEYLEQASDARTFLTAFVKAEPIFRELRDEQRFKKVLVKMDLSD
jgi:DNA-binding winged helix-turn-helix (wHTH) protein/TolB-like protein/Tfp pilus assembly protein PilF